MSRFQAHAAILVGMLAATFPWAQLPADKQDEKSIPNLPKPNATPSVVKHPEVIGWPKDRTPTALEGFRVAAFVTDIESPRWIYVLPNGDILVAQSRPLPKPK